MKVVSALALACLVVGASAIDGAETRANRGGVIEIPRGPTAWTSRRAGPGAGLPSRRDSPRDHHDDSRSGSVGISSVSAPEDVSNEAVPSKSLIYDPNTGTVVQQRILHMPSTLSVANPGWWAGIPADKLKFTKEVQPAAEEPAAEEPAAEEPAAKEPVVAEPAAEEPATEEPAAEKPAAEKPAAEEPVAEKPATEEPAAEKPVAEKPATAKPEHKTTHRRSARGDNNLVYQKDASGRLTAAPAVDEPTSEAVTDASIPTEANPSKPAAADTTKAQTPADKQSSKASGTASATDSDEQKDEQTHSSADNTTKSEDVNGAAEGPQDPAAADSTTAKPVGNSTAPPTAQTEKPAVEAKQPPVAAEQQPAAATKGATEQQPAAAAAAAPTKDQQPAAAAEPTKEQQPATAAEPAKEQKQAAAAEPAKEQKQATADSGAAVVPAPAPAQQQATTGEPADAAANVSKPAAATPTEQPVTAPAANSSVPSTQPANDSTASSVPTKAEQPASTATAPTETVATPDTPAANASAPTVHVSNAEEVVGSTIDAYMAEPAAARSAAEPRKRVVAQRKRQGVLRSGQIKTNQASPKRETTGGVFSIQSIHMASDPAVLMDAHEPKVVDVNPVPAVEQPAAAAAPEAAAEPAAAPQNASKTAATPDVPKTTDESRMRVADATQSAATPAAALPAAPQTEQPQTTAAPAAAATPKPAAAKPQEVPPAAGSIRLPNGMEVPANTFAMAGDSLLQGSSFFSKLAAYQATLNQPAAAAPTQSAPTVGGWQPAPITEAPAPAAQASSPAAASTEQTNTLPTQTTQPAPATPAAPAIEAKPAAVATPEAPAAADAAVSLLLGTSDSTPVTPSTPSTPTISKSEQTPPETPAAAPAQPAAAAAAADADNGDVDDQPVVSAPAPAEPVHNSQPTSTPASTVTVAEEPSDADASSEDDVIAIPSFGSQHETEEPAREELPTEEPAREGLPTEEPAQKEWLTGGTAPVAAAAAAAPSKHRETPRRGRPSASVELTPSRCGAGPDDSCEVANLCTARDGCQCQYSAGKKVDGVRLGTCGCSAAKGLATFSDNGISSCGWDVNFGQTKYYEVPRLGTIDLPVILGKNGVCPETGRNVIQTVNVDGASPMTCPRDADFVRLTYKRSGRWDSESCTSGRGNYVLRTTLRNAARGDCYAVPITTTDGKKHAIVFKYY